MSDVISSLAFISLPELPVEGCVFVEHSYKLPPPHLLMLSTHLNVFLLHTPVQPFTERLPYHNCQSFILLYFLQSSFCKACSYLPFHVAHVDMTADLYNYR